MGFTTGLLAGAALTTLTLHLTIQQHKQNRLAQSIALRQQAQVLRNIYDPLPPAPLPTAREERAGVVEMAKDRWNAEVEGAVRWVQRVDWTEVRQDAESTLRNLVKKAQEVGKESGK